ncbi:MAG TPA: phosphatidylglycerophosphatase A [Terriglobales bacterium]|nr:phosphatidylglycerophosphatase A [Terriglobales bacterium]
MKPVRDALATFFGLGFFPKAPGTAASAAAAILYLFVLHRLPWPSYLVFLAVSFFAGAFVSKAYAAEVGQADPQQIVVDEAFGQLLALVHVPARWPPVLAAFLFFRFFDIIKPGPIRKLEELPGGWGIMADDAAAGLIACALTQVLLILRGRLGT